MKTKDLISYSELAEECGVSQIAITKFVNRHNLPNYRLPHSPRGRALAPAQATLARLYYAAMPPKNTRQRRELIPA